ncbi:MAG: glycosyltransferase family 39 protein, partial [Candidatus Aenigmarchaeota archaeon]|nr:glycosyltransferase family 39 protein [Candidatus Aenigmarchaeota archaeon]
MADCIDGMVCLQALDPFYFYRTSLDMMNNNFHLVFDTLRYFPTGMDPHNMPPVVVYLPAVMYKVIAILIPSLSFYEWAKWYPAVMGAFMGIGMYFLGKELFNKKIGLLAGLLLAVNASTLYRTAAGFLEKEPTAAVFIILAFYFFVHALNKNSILSGVNAGLSLLMVNFSWGGANIIFLILAMITGIIVFFNIHPKAIYKVYPIITVIAILIPTIVNVKANLIYTYPYALLSFFTVGFVIVRYIIEKKRIVSEKDMKYAMPIISIIWLILALIGSFFSKTLASLFNTVSHLLNWSEDLVGTTVAENNPATWANIKAQLGAEYAQHLTPQLNSIIPYMSLWIFMLVGIVFLAYKLYKTKDWKYMFALVWVVASIYASFARIRIIFLLGAPAALAGAFGIYYLIKIFNNA